MGRWLVSDGAKAVSLADLSPDGLNAWVPKIERSTLDVLLCCLPYCRQLVPFRCDFRHLLTGAVVCVLDVWSRLPNVR